MMPNNPTNIPINSTTTEVTANTNNSLNNRRNRYRLALAILSISSTVLGLVLGLIGYSLLWSKGLSHTYAPFDHIQPYYTIGLSTCIGGFSLFFLFSCFFIFSVSLFPDENDARDGHNVENGEVEHNNNFSPSLEPTSPFSNRQGLPERGQTNRNSSLYSYYEPRPYQDQHDGSPNESTSLLSTFNPPPF